MNTRAVAVHSSLETVQMNSSMVTHCDGSEPGTEGVSAVYHRSGRTREEWLGEVLRDGQEAVCLLSCTWKCVC